MLIVILFAAAATFAAPSSVAHKDPEPSPPSPHTITTHKANYLLPLTYNSSRNRASFLPEDTTSRALEMKFQFSLKVPVWKNLRGKQGHLFFAYTQQSYWQAYSGDASRPFRETNQEPELFFDYTFNQYWQGLYIRNCRLGLSHQSNGQSGALSRSWDRVYGEVIWGQDANLVYRLKAWHRLPESMKVAPDSPKGDDNPDIVRYLGYAEFEVQHITRSGQLSAVARHNLRQEGRGSVELNWQFPLTDALSGFVQYFNGYGESLLDYNHSVNRVGLGVMITARP